MNNIQNTQGSFPLITGKGNAYEQENQQLRAQGEPGQAEPEKAKADFSGVGKLMSGVSQMNDAERQQIRQFRAEVKAARQEGTFDAGKLAESAPDVLKSLAGTAGLDLQHLVEHMGQGGTGRGRAEETGEAAVADYLATAGSDQPDEAATLVDTLLATEEKG